MPKAVRRSTPQDLAATARQSLQLHLGIGQVVPLSDQTCQISDWMQSAVIAANPSVTTRYLAAMTFPSYLASTNRSVTVVTSANGMVGWYVYIANAVQATGIVCAGTTWTGLTAHFPVCYKLTPLAASEILTSTSVAIGPTNNFRGDLVATNPTSALTSLSGSGTPVVSPFATTPTLGRGVYWIGFGFEGAGITGSLNSIVDSLAPAIPLITANNGWLDANCSSFDPGGTAPAKVVLTSVAVNGFTRIDSNPSWGIPWIGLQAAPAA